MIPTLDHNKKNLIHFLKISFLATQCRSSPWVHPLPGFVPSKPCSNNRSFKRLSHYLAPGKGCCVNRRPILPMYYFSCNQNEIFLAGAMHLKGRDSVNEGTEDAIDSSKVGTKLKGKKRKKQSPATKRKSIDESYWHDENDEFKLIGNDDDSVIISPEVNENATLSGLNRNKSIKFTIRGNPRPLVRHRTSRGFMYNPSQKAQESFRDSLLRILPRKYHPIIIDDVSTDNTDVEAPVIPTVFFSQDEFLEMSVKFRIKRPLSHFVGSKPGQGRIRPNAPGKLHNSRSDVDNLAKFVMDSLNGVLYVDDRQIVRLKAVKILDSEGLCRGATEVFIRTLNEEDIV